MNSMEGQHDNPAILAVDNDPDILAALLDLWPALDFCTRSKESLQW